MTCYLRALKDAYPIGVRAKCVCIKKGSIVPAVVTATLSYGIKIENVLYFYAADSFVELSNVERLVRRLV